MNTQHYENFDHQTLVQGQTTWRMLRAWLSPRMRKAAESWEGIRYRSRRQWMRTPGWMRSIATTVLALLGAGAIVAASAWQYYAGQANQYDMAMLTHDQNWCGAR